MQKSLKNQMLNGIAWSGSADIIQQILQVVFTIILARLLTRADFGMVAMALIVNRFARTISNMSFGTAIIQSQEISKPQISAIFCIQIILNVVLSTTVFFGAEVASNFFNEPELTSIIKALSILLLLQALQFPNLMLKKEMRFKSVSIAQIVSLVISNIIAISMAFSGFGVWSLVGRLLSQSIVFGLLSFYFGKWRPTKPSFHGIKPLLSFGFNLLGRNGFYFFTENMIGLLTGKYLGKEIMGLFNIAYNLAILPASKIQNILASVLTSGFSRIQYEIPKFRQYYEKALYYTALIFVPFMLFLSSISINVIPIFYGQKWQKAGELLMILSIVGMIMGLANMVRTAIVAKGNTKPVFHAAILEFLVSLPIMYFLINDYDIKGLILGHFAGALSGLLFLVFHFEKILQTKFMFFRAIKRGMLLGTAILISTNSIWFFHFTDLASLVLKLTIAIVVFTFFIYFSERKLLSLAYDKIRYYLKM